MPKYSIARMDFRDMPIPGTDKQGVAAEVSVTAFNKFPLSVAIPELAFKILLPGCDSDSPHIIVADAVTGPVIVQPEADVIVDVHGFLMDLPGSLTTPCPNSSSSPLDLFLSQFLNGKEPTFFVRGAKKGRPKTPGWIADVLSSVTIPVPFPKREFDDIIRNFSLSDVHFSLPDSSAEPDDPDSSPKVSGTIQVLADLPPELNLGINVTDVKASADVFYKSKKLGELNVQHWQKANSTKIESDDGQTSSLQIQSRIEDTPLNVTDPDVFTDVIQTLIFHGKTVILDIKASVDVKIDTTLGNFILKDIPASGKIPVKRPSSIYMSRVSVLRT
jgi:hypothetical protein